MSQANAMIEALEAVEAELKRLGSAVKAADPTAIRTAAAEGGKTAAAAAAQSLAAAADRVAAAAKDAAAAASAAKEAAAYAGRASPSWTGWVMAVGAMAAVLIAFAGGVFYAGERGQRLALAEAYAVREAAAKTLAQVPADLAWLSRIPDREMAEWSQRPEARNARAYWRHNHGSTCQPNSHRTDQGRPVCAIFIWNDWQTRGY